MPPRRYKVNHHKDKGSSYAGFLERNAEVLPEHMLKKRAGNRVVQEANSEDESSSEIEKPVPNVSKAVPVVESREHGSDDDVALEKEFGRPGMHDGETRKEREARQALEAKKRYEELQMAGKTAESKADLARLAEIRRKREAAAAKTKQDGEDKEQQRLKGRTSHASADYLREAFM